MPNKEQYQKNKEYFKQKNKEYYNKNKENLLKISKKYHEQNYEKHLVACAKSNAKVKNIPFNLSEKDIIIPTLCPFLGVELTKQQGCGRVSTNASIDRIDPELGYVKGNVQIISELANRMKQNASPDQLRMFAKGIFKIYGDV